MDIKQTWESVKDSGAFNEVYFLAIALILAFGIIQTTGSILDTGKPVVTVVSCSMYPDYDVGDVIIVRGEGFEDIAEGDVIVFDAQSPETDIPIIHRVIIKRDSSLETQGDNTRGQHEFEKNITPEQVYGKAFFKIPRIGLVKILAMDLVGFTGDQPLAIDSTPQCYRV